MTEQTMTRKQLVAALSDGRMVRLSGNGHRGATGYHTHSNGTADAIVPHERGAVLVLLDKGDPDNFSQWASIRGSALETDPLVASYLSLWGRDQKNEAQAFARRQAAGQVA